MILLMTAIEPSNWRCYASVIVSRFFPFLISSLGVSLLSPTHLGFTTILFSSVYCCCFRLIIRQSVWLLALALHRAVRDFLRIITILRFASLMSVSHCCKQSNRPASIGTCNRFAFIHLSLSLSRAPSISQEPPKSESAQCQLAQQTINPHFGAAGNC